MLFLLGVTQQYNEYAKLDLVKLYPTYKAFITPDRRQQNIQVECERRSGSDRRATVRLDEKTKTDISDVKTKIEAAISIIPACRKGLTALLSFQGSDWQKALLQTFRLINDFPEDGRDTIDAYKSLKSLKPTDKEMRGYQRPFSFTRGTIIENKRIGLFLKQYDKTLFDYKATRKFLSKIGLKKYVTKEGKKKIEGNIFVKVLGRATMRVPVLSIAFMAIIEMFDIRKAENKKKQAVKASFKTVSIIGLSAIIGAIGAFRSCFLGFVGIGVGYLLGKELSKKFNTTLGRYSS